MLPEDIIIKPIITEKSNAALATGKYTFQVAKFANKTQIAEAVRKLFRSKSIKSKYTNCSRKRKKSWSKFRNDIRMEKSNSNNRHKPR